MGTAAGVQNVAPIPVADIVVLFAAFLLATTHLGWLAVFLAAWLGNAGLALVLYGLARHYRARRPDSRVVRWLLRLRGSRENLRDWSPLSVFVGSFLPVRPLLPLLAGLGEVAFWRLALPLAAAAGVWYAAIVLLGTTGGRSFGAVVRAFATFNREFTIAVLALTVVAVVWWLARRRRSR